MRFLFSYVFLLPVGSLSFQLNEVPLTFLIRPQSIARTPLVFPDWKTFIFPLVQDDNLVGWSIFGWKFLFPFSVFEHTMLLSLSLKGFAENSADKSYRDPIICNNVTSCFFSPSSCCF